MARREVCDLSQDFASERADRGPDARFTFFGVNDQINQLLDQTLDAEDAVPFGDLAQAAMEAKLELKRRGASEV